MQEERNIIIGGGISGLIYAYYNPSYLLISDKLGGQLKSKFQTGPKYIHCDEYSEKFFNDLGLYLPKRKIKVGYWYDNALHDVNTDENKKTYFEKTRGETSTPYSSVMSSNKNEFECYDIDMNIVINHIIGLLQNTIYLEKINKIDIVNKHLEINNNIIKFDNIVSTIPKNIFLMLSDNKDKAEKYKSFPTTFVLKKDTKDCPFDVFKEYDYVYVSEKKYPFHRITKTKEGVVYEYKGDNIEKSYNEVDREILKVGQLIQNEEKIEFNNVTFFGRYGKWKHNILINDLIKEIKK